MGLGLASISGNYESAGFLVFGVFIGFMVARLEWRCWRISRKIKLLWAAVGEQNLGHDYRREGFACPLEHILMTTLVLRS